MAISYTQVGWDTSKYVNPTNMNQMDNGIKAACDGVDALDTEMGTTSISGLGDGTVTGAISALNSNSAKYNGLSGTTYHASTNDEITSAIATQIAKMSNQQTAIVTVSVDIGGLKLNGGLHSAIIQKGDNDYYSALFFGYSEANRIVLYRYEAGTQYWYSFSGTAI